MNRYSILAIDEGTTNCKAILVDETGKIQAKGSSPVPVKHPRSDWVEQDANEIWNSTIDAVKKCLSNHSKPHVVALGISNQRESITIWNRKTGEPLGPVITWQCRRTSSTCEKLINDGHEANVISSTGLPLDPMFSATKAKWLLDNHGKGTDINDICIGTIDSWLIWKFSNCTVHATDFSNASRTQLFNLPRGTWDESLCELFGIPIAILPTIHESSFMFGKVKGVKFLSDGIPITSAIGDSHAALFGHGAFEMGDSKVTFGTGSSIMTTIPEFIEPPQGVTTTVAWSLNKSVTFALEGNILVSASILPWTAEILGMKSVEELLEAAESVKDSSGVSLVPALVGLGSPHWNSRARGLICGLTFPVNRAHIARAAAESIALQVFDIFKIIKKINNNKIGRLFVDGKPSKSSFLMSLVTNYLNHPLTLNEFSDASACGAAYLAGLATRFWNDINSISNLNRDNSLLMPNIRENDRQKILNSWDIALKRAML